MPNLISQCCKAPVVPGIKREYPLGGHVFYESFLIDVCEACGKETEPMHACEYCGEEANGDNPLIFVGNEEHCHCCINEVIAQINRESVIA